MAYQIGVRKKIRDATPDLFEYIVKTVPVKPAAATIVMAAYGIVEPALGLGGKSTSQRDKYLAECSEKGVIPFREEIFEFSKGDRVQFNHYKTNTSCAMRETAGSIMRGGKPNRVIVEIPFPAADGFCAFLTKEAEFTGSIDDAIGPIRLEALSAEGYQMQGGHLWFDYEYSHGNKHSWQGIRLEKNVELTLYEQENSQFDPKDRKTLLAWFKELLNPANVD